MKMHKHIGQRIREIRLQQGLSQPQLAKRAGMSRSYLTQLEQGSSEPTVSKAIAIAKALKTTLSYLIEERIEDEYNGA
jgi:transcriptional regulator with XRE-family HTH domain